jgi:hypothetical protein
MQSVFMTILICQLSLIDELSTLLDFCFQLIINHIDGTRTEKRKAQTLALAAINQVNNVAVERH